MLQFTDEELALMVGALTMLLDDSRLIATDRTTTKEYRSRARRQSKVIHAAIQKISQELDKHPEGEPFTIIHY